MGRLRKTSKILEKAQVRIAGLKAIDPALDLGNGLTVAAFEAKIVSTAKKLADYNQELAVVDEMQNSFVTEEDSLKDISERMLAGVGARFGKDSSQYEQAGGTRKSERKPRARKLIATPAPPNPAPST